MAENLTNGAFQACPILKDWEEHKKLLEETAMRTQRIESAVSNLHFDTKHLKHIAETLDAVKDGLLNAVLGKDIIPIEVFVKTMENQSKSYEKVIMILVCLFAVILGLKFLAPNLLQ